MSEKPEASEKFDWNKYSTQYQKDHYTSIKVTIPKDSDIKERIKAAAERAGLSVNQWIIKAIDKELEWYE